MKVRYAFQVLRLTGDRASDGDIRKAYGEQLQAEKPDELRPLLAIALQTLLSKTPVARETEKENLWFDGLCLDDNDRRFLHVMGWEEPAIRSAEGDGPLHSVQRAVTPPAGSPLTAADEAPREKATRKRARKSDEGRLSTVPPSANGKAAAAGRCPEDARPEVPENTDRRVQLDVDRRNAAGLTRAQWAKAIVEEINQHIDSDQSNAWRNLKSASARAYRLAVTRLMEEYHASFEFVETLFLQNAGVEDLRSYLAQSVSSPRNWTPAQRDIDRRRVVNGLNKLMNWNPMD